MDLESLSSQNPWWRNGKAILEDEKVKRALAAGERMLVRLWDRNSIMIGPRQLGKTTALKYDIYLKIMKDGIDPGNILYYSFDTARDYNVISDVINTFMGATEGKRYIYLDEVSFVPEWQRAIKFFLDSGSAKDARLYVTGSSSINLRKELFPGREIVVRNVLPATFHDFVIALGSKELAGFVSKNSSGDIAKAEDAARKATRHFDELSTLFRTFLGTGGFPLAVFDNMSNGRINESTIETHWNAFLSDISKAERSVDTAAALIRELIGSYSSKVNMSKLAREAGILSHVTAREYMELFKELFLVGYIFPVNKRRKPLFRKERKVYFIDPFLLNMFSRKLNIQIPLAESKAAEGAVYSLLSRIFDEIGYIENGKEIDFVADDTAIEVKWQGTVGEKDRPKSDLKRSILLSKSTAGNGIVPLPTFAALLSAELH
jgi:hypothetical protein